MPKSSYTHIENQIQRSTSSETPSRQGASKQASAKSSRAIGEKRRDLGAKANVPSSMNGIRESSPQESEIENSKSPDNSRQSAMITTEGEYTGRLASRQYHPGTRHGTRRPTRNLDIPAWNASTTYCPSRPIVSTNMNHGSQGNRHQSIHIEPETKILKKCTPNIVTSSTRVTKRKI